MLLNTVMCHTYTVNCFRTPFLLLLCHKHGFKFLQYNPISDKTFWRNLMKSELDKDVTTPLQDCTCHHFDDLMVKFETRPITQDIFLVTLLKGGG